MPRSPVTEEKPAEGYGKNFNSSGSRREEALKYFSILHSAFEMSRCLGGYENRAEFTPPAPQTNFGFRPPPRRDWRRCRQFPRGALRGSVRSEERRVGKEGRSR